MAASEANVLANRRNARLSTGPRSAAGKTAVARHALKHGLTGQHATLLPDEQPADFLAFAAVLQADLAPQGAIESLLAERVIGYAWRLRRALRIELGIFAHHATYEGQVELGYAFVRDGTGPCSEAFHRLSRYEASLERGMLTMLRELHRLQAARNGEARLPPVQVDMNIAGD